MPKLINHAEAVAFWDTIEDPIVQAIIQHAHSLIFTDACEYFTTDFDALLFYKVLEALFRDRKRLANFLTMEVEETTKPTA
jgi:hypothetical protein